MHYCIIRVCHIKRRKLSWACHNCFIAGHGTLPSYRCGLISKSAITTYRTLKCALSDLMHCFRSIWLVRCHVTSNKPLIHRSVTMGLSGSYNTPQTTNNPRCIPYIIAQCAVASCTARQFAQRGCRWNFHRNIHDKE